MKILILLFLFVSYVHGRKTMVVRMDYASLHTGMFHIPIKNGTTVTNVMWCSELLPPQPGQKRRDIKDCHARGILKAQVYPGDTRYYKFKDEKRSIQISPQAIGGFWLNRQADIVIHGTINDGREDYEQIVRINPLVAIGGEEVKMVDDHVPVEKPQIPIIINTNNNDKEKGNPGNGHVSIHTEAETTKTKTTFPSKEEEEEPDPISSPKLALFITLGFGVVVMIATIFLAAFRRIRVQTPYHKSPLSSLQFTSSSNSKMYRGLEEDLRLAMDDDELFVVIGEKDKEQEYQEYLEDQSILNQMGKK